MAAALLAAVLGACRNEAAPAETHKPTVHVLTSLPLLFDAEFGLGPATGEAATFLRDHYTLQPIDLPSQLPKGAVLLAAQPRALPAEELMALDKWVRDGGKLLLLADPLLEWPSKRPLGDRLRPPISFADTGLLGNWGLRLDAPDERGLQRFPSEMANVDTLSPGRLVKVGGECSDDADGVSATCRLGRGEVLIIADADWLNVEAVRSAGGDPDENLAMLDLQLSRLTTRSESWPIRRAHKLIHRVVPPKAGRTKEE